jgi:hypothetical protein
MEQGGAYPMSELSDTLEKYRRGPELIATAMTGAAGAELDYVPAAGQWSIRQILCHVADAEIVAAARFRRIVAENRPAIVAYDQDAWAANLDYASRKIAEAMETFRHIRAWNYDLLHSLPEAAFERTGIHQERGELTLLALLGIYARHAEKHAEQIRRVRAAYKESRSKS